MLSARTPRANGYFAGLLTDLGTGTNVASRFLSADLTGSATVSKSGYTVRMTGVGSAVTTTTACVSGVSIYPAYTANADPVTAGSTGVRSFGTTEHGKVFQNTGAAVTFNTSTRVVTAGTSLQ